MLNEALKPIQKKLEEVYDKDQDIRSKWDSYIDKYGNNSKEFKEYLLLIDKIQENNLKIVEEIISKYGWLPSKIIGNKASSALFLVIQHSADLKTMEKYASYIESAFTNSNLDNQYYAMFKDRLLLYQNKKQIYGTQYIYDNKTSNYILENPLSIKEMNRNRQSIGLEPIKGEKK